MKQERAVGYIRQSVTKDDDSLSLATQTRIIRDIATQRSLVLVEVFADPDRRGWDEARPGLASALARCEQGDIGWLIVHDMSRLARSLRLTEQYAYRLSTLGVEIVSHLEPHISTPLYRHLLGAIHEESTRTISANWRRVLSGRHQRGLSHGTVPYGYVRTTKGGPIVPDLATSATVRDLFARYAEGSNIQDLATDLIRRGVPAPRGGDWWTTQTVAQILDNPVYVGVVTLNGEAVPGQHAAIVDEETWDAVRERRAAAARPVRHKACSSWLEGHIRHACGAAMHLQCACTKGRTERPRFRCWRISHAHNPEGPCPIRPAQIPAYRAEPLVRGILAADLASIRPLADVLAEVRREGRRQAPGADDARKRLEAEAARVAEARRRAEDLYLSAVRDRAWFDAQEAGHAAEAERIARELTALPQPPALDEVRTRGRRLRDLGRLVPRMADADLALVLAEVGTVVVGPEGVGVVYHEAYARHLGRED